MPDGTDRLFRTNAVVFEEYRDGGSRTTAALPGVWSGVSGVEQSMRRTEAELRACSDAVLKDIGIDRSEITADRRRARPYRRGPQD